MNNRQQATIVAALGYFEQNRSLALVTMTEHFQNVRPLASAEIDQLCQDLRRQPTDDSNESILAGIRNRVIIVVEGGVVQSVFANRAINVDVLDHDNWEATDQASSPQEWRRYEALADEVGRGNLAEQAC